MEMWKSPMPMKVLKIWVCHQIVTNQGWNTLALSGSEGIKGGASSTKKQEKYSNSYRNRWTRMSAATSHKDKDAKDWQVNETPRNQGPPNGIVDSHQTSDVESTRAGTWVQKVGLDHKGTHLREMSYCIFRKLALRFKKMQPVFWQGGSLRTVIASYPLSLNCNQTTFAMNPWNCNSKDSWEMQSDQLREKRIWNWTFPHFHHLCMLDFRIIHTHGSMSIL